MAYTIEEKLKQTIDAPAGSMTEPAWLWEELEKTKEPWSEPLRRMAKEALAEIERLEKFEPKPKPTIFDLYDSECIPGN